MVGENPDIKAMNRESTPEAIAAQGVGVGA